MQYTAIFTVLKITIFSNDFVLLKYSLKPLNGGGSNEYPYSILYVLSKNKTKQCTSLFYLLVNISAKDSHIFPTKIIVDLIYLRFNFNETLTQ